MLHPGSRFRPTLPRSARALVAASLVLAPLAPAARPQGCDDPPIVPELTPSWTIEGDAFTASLGRSIASAGDVNGDGFEDLIVGSPAGGANNAGVAHVFHGGPNGVSTTPDWSVNGGYDGTVGHWGVGTAVAGIGDVNGDGFDDVAVGSPATNNGTHSGTIFVWLGSASGVNGGVDGTVTNYAWRAIGGTSGMRLGEQLAGPLDVNGDGFADLLASAIHFTSAPAELDEGAAFLWFGSASGLNGGVAGDSTTAPWHVEGDAKDVQLGIEIAAIGDVNGDHVDDLAIAARLDHPYHGAVWVFHGASGGPAASLALADWHLEGGVYWCGFGEALAGRGDANGDGFGDLLIGSPRSPQPGSNSTLGAAALYLGSSGGLAYAPAWRAFADPTRDMDFGRAVAFGDVDGDAFDDLVVGTPRAWDPDFSTGFQAGAVALWHGDLHGAEPSIAWRVVGGVDNFYGTGGEFGAALAVLDENGDGSADVFVGVPSFGNAIDRQGRVHRFSGPDVGVKLDACVSPEPAVTLDGPTPGGDFGFHVANAGDVDGDGRPDLLIAAPHAASSSSREGAVWLHRGGPNGPELAPWWTQFGGSGDRMLGTSIAAAGDVNGDGFDDFLVGAVGMSDAPFGYLPGEALLYAGGASGPTLLWHATSSIVPDHFGWSVAGLGDVDGDGYDDIAVGARGYDQHCGDDPWSDVPGRVFVFHGGPAGPRGGLGASTADADWIAESDVVTDLFGSSVAGGDVNGDGHADLLVGAPDRQASDGTLHAGALYLWTGSASGMNGGAQGFVGSNAAWSASGELYLEALGGAVAFAGDVDRDGFDDLLAGGAGYSPSCDLVGAGRAQLWRGAAAPSAIALAWSVTGDRAYANFGKQVAGIGDWNGDRCDDFAIAATGLTNGERAEGRVAVFAGSRRFLPAFPCWRSEVSLPDARFGSGLAATGDVDGDGRDDLAAGCPNVESPSGRGRVLFWRGTRHTLLVADPGLVHAGEVLSLLHTGGAPSSQLLLYAIDLGGVPLFMLLAAGTLDLDACWRLDATVPAGLAGLDLTLQSYCFDPLLRIVSSNPALVELR